MEFPNEREMVLFVGENADKFMYRWRPILMGIGRNAKFNYAAFFLTHFGSHIAKCTKRH